MSTMIRLIRLVIKSIERSCVTRLRKADFDGEQNDFSMCIKFRGAELHYHMLQGDGIKTLINCVLSPTVVHFSSRSDRSHMKQKKWG